MFFFRNKQDLKCKIDVIKDLPITKIQFVTTNNSTSIQHLNALLYYYYYYLE